jgi:hypothetical protein
MRTLLQINVLAGRNASAFRDRAESCWQSAAAAGYLPRRARADGAMASGVHQLEAMRWYMPGPPQFGCIGYQHS